jgi:hypothetical protein
VTHREFIAWLRRVERDYPVTDWKVRGIRVWPLVRLSLYSSNFHAGTPAYALGTGLKRYALVASEALVSWARAAVLDWRANRGPAERADAVFLTYSVGTQPLVAGQRYNPLLAPYVELLEGRGRRVTVWEMSPFGDYNIPRSVPSCFIQPYLIALRVRCQMAPLGREEIALDGYHAFLARVREAGLVLPHADLDRLRRDALFIRRLADRFKRWLRRARPSLGFVADAGLREQAFCLACRELGIRSVELQHGIQGANHPAYGSWLAVPPGGYHTRPQVFWVWDGESEAAIAEWAAPGPAGPPVVIGGNPWREMWQGDGEAVSRTHAAIAQCARSLAATKHILVTLDARGDVIPPPLLEAIRHAPAGWRWWLRLHPVDQAARRSEARRLLPGLGQSPDLMEHATEFPLHALLRHMDGHFTAGRSTVVQEAAELGVPSVACDPEAADFYAAEIARGALRIARTGGEILAALEAAMADPPPVRIGSRPDPQAAMDTLLDGFGPGERES